ncbi:MAG: molybdopterin cofactor-binding domain-containing protein, partial [Anaerolineales bacterium]
TAQSTFVLECALDELIETLGDHPVDFRLQNCIGPQENCFLGYPLEDMLGYPKVLETIKPYYHQLVQEAESYNATHNNGPLRRGVGLSGMWYRFGKAGALNVETHAELAADGHFIVYCSAPDYGQGTNTVMSQIAAEAFGVDRDRIEIVNADTARVPNSDIQGASRATFFVGGAVQKVAQELLQSLFGVAAELLDVPMDQLRLESDRVIANDKRNQSISLVEVGQEFDRIGKSRRVQGRFDITSSLKVQPRPEYVPLFVTGAQVADLTVDMETGMVNVLRVVAAHDVGKVVNPLDAAGQIEGAIVMGIGAALSEEYLPGQTTALSQYIVPMVGSLPEIKTILIEVPSRLGPYGVKGLGEAAMLPTTPAIINAVSRAIGTRIRSIPATPERIVSTIRKSKSATDKRG